MPSPIKMQSKLPSGSKNGLPSVIDEIHSNPSKIRYALVAFDCESTTTNFDNGDVTPTLRVLRIEPVLRDDMTTVRRLMEHSLERRTGVATLPMDDETLAALSGE